MGTRSCPRTSYRLAEGKIAIIYFPRAGSVGGGRAESVAGLHGLSIRNMRGETSVEGKKRKWTWKSPVVGSRNQIDSILFNKSLRRALLAAKIYPEADCYSDHVPVAAKFKLALQKTRSKANTSNLT